MRRSSRSKSLSADVPAKKSLEKNVTPCRKKLPRSAIKVGSGKKARASAKDRHDSSSSYESDDSKEILGKNVFTFRTAKKKTAMANKATMSVERCQLLGKNKRRVEEKKKSVNASPKSAAKSPTTDTASGGLSPSPRKRLLAQIRTPNTVRRKIKSKLNKMAADGQASSSQESESGEEDVTDQSEEEAETGGASQGAKGRVASRSSRSTSMKAEAEKYFVSHAAESKTSDHTLSKLGLPKFDRQSLNEMLARVPQTHATQIERLTTDCVAQFPKWIFQMSQGFNIIIYGLGSKIQLLREFKARLQGDNAVLVINGFFPGLTTKQILLGISRDILEHEGDFSRAADHVRFIHQSLSSQLYLLVHNIDGVALRPPAAQQLLCSLVQHPNVHLVASVDHINAPLLWDLNLMSRFNWLWQDCTTFAPYLGETSYENSLFVKQSSSSTLSSLRHVFHSLTPNARGIFMLLVRYQLLHGETKNYAGMAFHDCYQQCRKAFLVNSEPTLKAQLTEFKDHVLLKIKKGSDGGEYLFIPLDPNTMTDFIAQQEE